MGLLNKQQQVETKNKDQNTTNQCHYTRYGGKVTLTTATEDNITDVILKEIDMLENGIEQEIKVDISDQPHYKAPAKTHDFRVKQEMMIESKLKSIKENEIQSITATQTSSLNNSSNAVIGAAEKYL